MQRCTNKSHKHYQSYGGRGIIVCERWTNFENFYKDMGAKPDKQHTIERVNNDKGYSKNNCVWATQIEQAHNRRIRTDNTSGVPGIYWEKRTRKWQVQICAATKRISLGCYKHFADAISAREKGELIYW